MTSLSCATGFWAPARRRALDVATQLDRPPPQKMHGRGITVVFRRRHVLGSMSHTRARRWLVFGAKTGLLSPCKGTSRGASRRRRRQLGGLAADPSGPGSQNTPYRLPGALGGPRARGAALRARRQTPPRAWAGWLCPRALRRSRAAPMENLNAYMRSDPFSEYNYQHRINNLKSITNPTILD